ncbi:MAG: tetratricopeptide repeat protein [Alphaproteobacteria bacterium]|nr:tetratricopeptide repeat protein [Alphaproteobacteria bacterium]
MAGNRQQRRAQLARNAGSRSGGGAGTAASRNLIGSLLNRAVQAHRVGDLKEAIARYEQALAIDPRISEALSNLGLALKSAGRLEDAIGRYQQALDLKPNSPEILSNLGIAFREQGRAADAVACYRKALALKPDYPSALSNLGNALKDLGEFDEAFDCYRKALALKPVYPDVLTNLGTALFELHYVQKYCERSTLDAARLYGRYASPSPPRTSFRNDREPGRRLRVGYVSNDFHDHPVGFLIQGPLSAHDPAVV